MLQVGWSVALRKDHPGDLGDVSTRQHRRDRIEPLLHHRHDTSAKPAS